MINYLRRLGRGGDVLSELLRPKIAARKRIVVDFSSPNIAKHFHVGNLRSTLIGEFCCNINKLAGHEVIKFNYLGDWGTQIALLATHWPDCKYKQNFDQMGEDATAADRLRPLMDCYVEAWSISKDNPRFREERALDLLDTMEEALIQNRFDDTSLATWAQIRKFSIEYLNQFYKRMGISFDVWDAESNYVAEARRLKNIILKSDQIFTTVENLQAIKHDGTYMVISKSKSNSTLYLNRELAATIARHERFNADSYVYVVDRQQTSHFKNLRYLLKMCGNDELASKIEHVPFGRIIGYSSRKGVVETVEDILEDAAEEAIKFITKSRTIKIADHEIPEVSQEIGEAALIFSTLQRSRATEYAFKSKLVLKNGDVSFYIHEKYARLCSLIDNNADLLKELENRLQSDMSKLSLETDDTARTLFQCLYELDSSLFSSYYLLETSPFISYLNRLAYCVGPAIAQLHVKNEPNRDVAINRLLLFVAARNVMREGLELLGIKPLSRI